MRVHVDIALDTKDINKAVRMPTTPGGPVLKVDTANMELEGRHTGLPCAAGQGHEARCR